MNNHDKIITLLKKNEVKTGWREKAEWRRANQKWLRYSQFIALKVLNRLDEVGMSQKELSERMKCSQQYVSKLLRGSENLTLETIAKIETALDMDLVHSSLSWVHGYESPRQATRLVADENKAIDKGDSWIDP